MIQHVPEVTRVGHGGSSYACAWSHQVGAWVYVYQLRNSIIAAAAAAAAAAVNAHVP
jgi:hypothetical protein